MATHICTLVLFDCACDMDHESVIKQNEQYLVTYTW